MNELFQILSCIGLIVLVGIHSTAATPVALPWHSDQRNGVVTLALWDRTSPAMRADGVPLPGARLLTPTERSAITTAVDAWNVRLGEAGVPLRVEIVTAQDADILVFGADSLADIKGRPLEGITSLRIRDADSSLSRIERVSMAITSPRVCLSELGRALGIVVPAPRNILAGLARTRLPDTDVRLLLTAYGIG